MVRDTPIFMLTILTFFVVPDSAGHTTDDGTTTTYYFPVADPHLIRDPTGDFGAPRSGHDPTLYGNYILVHGMEESRSSFYAHMRRPALFQRGDCGHRGERIGAVGRTGNAGTKTASPPRWRRRPPTP